MKSMDKDPWWIIARRLLERNWIEPLLLLIVVGLVVESAFEHQRWWLGSALIAGLVAVFIWVIVTGERSRLRRLARQAISQLPVQDGYVVLRGVVAVVDTPLVEPHTRTACAVAWYRTVFADERDAICDAKVGATDFVLECGDDLIAVNGSSAEVLAEPSQAMSDADHDIRCRNEWIVAAIGDPVIVAGVLSHGPEAHPHRRAAQITAAPGHKVTIGLIGKARDKRINR